MDKGARQTGAETEVRSRKTMTSDEIKRLKEKGIELMDQLKRFSQQVDFKMAKIKVKKQETVEPAMLTMKLENELGCLKKMSRVYLTEIEELKEKLKNKTGYEKLSEIENRIDANQKKYEELLIEKRDLSRLVKDAGNKLNKEDFMKENGVPQHEVKFESNGLRKAKFSR